MHSSNSSDFSTIKVLRYMVVQQCQTTTNQYMTGFICHAQTDATLGCSKSIDMYICITLAIASCILYVGDTKGSSATLLFQAHYVIR